MALKNKNTGEYLKIDFGYLPMPIVKIFKSEQSRIDFNPNWDKYIQYPFDIDEFNKEISTIIPNPELSLLNNFKSLVYSKIKKELITTKLVDDVEITELIWEDC